jgi:RND family efflux transporter MFP subunit
MKRILGWFFLRKKLTLVLIVIAAIAIFFVTRGNGNGELEEATVERGSVAEELILSGVVVAEEHAQLTFPTSGKIAWISVKEGEEVQEGQALAKLDTVTLNSTLQRARADYRAAEANAQEVLDDVKGNDDDETFTEKNTRTAAETARDKAYEAMVAAEKNLREATLISPFGGVVTNVVNPFAGVNVLATQTQIEVVNPETIHFVVAADQSEVIDIAIGDTVKIILDALDEKELFGIVSYVSYTTSATEIGSVYEVKVVFNEIENSDFTYRIGMTGDAHFVLREKKNVLYAPSDFVKADSEGDYVLTNEGREKTYIEIGLEGEERTEVVSGLSEGVLVYD